MSNTKEAAKTPEKISNSDESVASDVENAPHLSSSDAASEKSEATVTPTSDDSEPALQEPTIPAPQESPMPNPAVIPAPARYLVKDNITGYKPGDIVTDAMTPFDDAAVIDRLILLEALVPMEME